GAAVLVEPGLEPAAVFEDRALVRRLLRGESDEHDGDRYHDGDRDAAAEHGAEASQHDVAERFDALLDALRDKDRALQNLAANEMALAPSLREHFGPREREAMRRFARDPHSSELGRMALLESAARDPKRYGENWALDTAAQLLSATPTGGFTAQA